VSDLPGPGIVTVLELCLLVLVLHPVVQGTYGSDGYAGTARIIVACCTIRHGASKEAGFAALQYTTQVQT
jgi:hypothetical protein